MYSPLVAKRALKFTAGCASVLLRPTATASAGACVFLYHRVSGARVAESRLDDWNVLPAALERQVAWLAEHTELTFVRDLRTRLAAGGPAGRPVACLTFDDGFQNFHDEVLPILVRHRARATVFVVTGYIGADAPMPFDRWGLKHAGHAPPIAWRPLNWDDLGRCVATGLVEVGAHSHRHRNAAESSTEEMVDEAGTSREILLRRLGSVHARSYAYPYGSSRLGQVPGRYVSAVQAAGYSTAVTTDPGLVHQASPPLVLPRLEVVGTDRPAVLHAKMSGSLAPYRVLDKLRRARR